MGVMICGRKDCDNIMCNRYSKTYGYICDSCFTELICSNLSIDKFMISSKFEEYNAVNNRLLELNKEFEYDHERI